MDTSYSVACAMDASGFLSPKANAFSIAHLIDASQCIQDGACMRMNDLFNWSSQLLTKEMEGERFLKSRNFCLNYPKEISDQVNVSLLSSVELSP